MPCNLTGHRASCLSQRIPLGVGCTSSRVHGRQKAVGLSDGQRFIKNEGPWIIGLIWYRNGLPKKPSVLWSLSQVRRFSWSTGREPRTMPVSFLYSKVPDHSEKCDSHKTDLTSSRPFQILCPSLLLHHLSTQQENFAG